jgi:hypothetical protein
MPPSADDVLALLRAHEGNAWTPDPPATEEQVAEAEKSLGVRLVAAYRCLLLASDGGSLSGGEARIYFYPVRDLPEFSDGSYFPELLGVLVFGDDEGDFIYYFDPEGRYGKGAWAVFMVEKGCPDRESSRYLAPDLRHFINRILAGDSFFEEPFLG